MPAWSRGVVRGWAVAGSRGWGGVRADWALSDRGRAGVLCSAGWLWARQVGWGGGRDRGGSGEVLGAARGMVVDWPPGIQVELQGDARDDC